MFQVGRHLCNLLWVPWRHLVRPVRHPLQKRDVLPIQPQHLHKGQNLVYVVRAPHPFYLMRQHFVTEKRGGHRPDEAVSILLFQFLCLSLHGHTHKQMHPGRAGAIIRSFAGNRDLLAFFPCHPFAELFPSLLGCPLPTRTESSQTNDPSPRTVRRLPVAITLVLHKATAKHTVG